MASRNSAFSPCALVIGPQCISRKGAHHVYGEDQDEDEHCKDSKSPPTFSFGFSMLSHRPLTEHKAGRRGESELKAKHDKPIGIKSFGSTYQRNKENFLNACAATRCIDWDKCVENLSDSKHVNSELYLTQARYCHFKNCSKSSSGLDQTCPTHFARSQQN
jgi:hypothetical protein